MDRIRSNISIFLVLSLVLGSLGLAASLALATDQDKCDTRSGEELPMWPPGTDPDDPHHSPFGGDARGDTGTATPIPDPEDDWSGHVEGWSCDGARGESGSDPSCFEQPGDLGHDDCEAGSEVFVGGNKGGKDANDVDHNPCAQASVKVSDPADMGDVGANASVVVDVDAEQPEDKVKPEAGAQPGSKQECSDHDASEANSRR